MTEITSNFRWRTRSGDFVNIEDMDTHHLFYTVKMIWNHSVPEQYKIKPFQQYRFPAIYTPKYIREATAAMLCELKTRDDITDYWLAQLHFMVVTSRDVLQMKLSEEKAGEL